MDFSTKDTRHFLDNVIQGIKTGQINSKRDLILHIEQAIEFHCQNESFLLPEESNMSKQLQDIKTLLRGHNPVAGKKNLIFLEGQLKEILKLLGDES